MKDIQIIDIDSVEYPARLRDIPNPPQRLYCTGDTALLKARSIGVVGSRKNTVYGKNVAIMIYAETLSIAPHFPANTK